MRCSLDGGKYFFIYTVHSILTHLLTVPRKPRKSAKAVTIKTEPVSPKNKRKLKQLSPSDDDAEEAAVSSVLSAPQKKGKGPKASGSKQQGDGVVMVRKSTRLNDPPPAKRARMDGASLFQRLAREFAGIAKTCEEISEGISM